MGVFECSLWSLDAVAAKASFSCGEPSLADRCFIRQSLVESLLAIVDYPRVCRLPLLSIMWILFIALTTFIAGKFAAENIAETLPSVIADKSSWRGEGR